MDYSKHFWIKKKIQLLFIDSLVDKLTGIKIILKQKYVELLRLELNQLKVRKLDLKSSNHETQR